LLYAQNAAEKFGEKVFRFGGVNRLLYRRGGDVKVTEKEKLQNRELIACLYEQYKNYMYSLAVKYAEGHQDCDDIVQDAVMRLIHNADTLERLDEGRIVAYINLTVRSTALDFLDRKKICSKYFDSELQDHVTYLENPSGWENTVEEAFIKAERNSAVHRAMQRVPERFRLLLIGKYYLGLDDGELLVFRGCQVQSLRSLMTRARRILQKELRKEGITDEKY
jgi:RNA polymerase sigma-70 factor (ECF subfamily)